MVQRLVELLNNDDLAIRKLAAMSHTKHEFIQAMREIILANSEVIRIDLSEGVVIRSLIEMDPISIEVTWEIKHNMCFVLGIGLSIDYHSNEIADDMKRYFEVVGRAVKRRKLLSVQLLTIIEYMYGWLMSTSH